MERIEELEAILKFRTEELNSTNKAFAEYVESKQKENKELKEELLDESSELEAMKIVYEGMLKDRNKLKEKVKELQLKLQ